MAENPTTSKTDELLAFRRKHATGLVTLLFTDVVDSTALKQHLGELPGDALLTRHHDLVRDCLKRFPTGREISTAGDLFFLMFAVPSQAVAFALVLQARGRALAAEVGSPLQDRIGIHLGEVALSETDSEAASQPLADLHSLQIDICARVMATARGGQILVTRPVFDSARQVLKGEDLEGVGPLAWVSHGDYVLKGVEDAVEICEVGEQFQEPFTRPPTTIKSRRLVAAEGELVLGWRPAIGQQVPNTQWTLERQLGVGGFGEVWLGRHATLKERRVFKFCFRADRVRALKREVTLFRLLKEQLGDNPHIVAVREVFFDEPPFYIVMDYADGHDLRDWCEAQGGVDKVPLETRLELVAQAAEALQAAHDAGVIHRDVKPGNILVESPKSKVQGPKSTPPAPASADHAQPSTFSSQLHVRLCDFGIGQVTNSELLAKVTRAGFTQTVLGPGSSHQTGTYLYMAPELFAGRPATIHSDIYSLGVVLFQMLVGDFTQPLTTDWVKEVADPFLREDLSRCFAGNPTERFARAGDLAKRLRSLPERREAPVRLAAALAAHERAVYRRGVVLIAAVLVLLTIGLRLWQPGFLQRLELLSYDWRVRLARQSAVTATNLGFVFIDDRSIAAVKDGSVGLRFGLYWPRQVYGRVVRELRAQGPRAVAFDVMFTESRPDHPFVMMADGVLVDSDDFFALQVQQASNVIIAATADAKTLELVATNALGIGDISTDKDADGILRRAKAFRTYRRWHPAFRQVETDVAYGIDLNRARVEPGQIVLQRSDGEEIKVPVDSGNNFNLADVGTPPPSVAPKAKAFTEERVWDIGIMLAARELALDLSKADVNLAAGRITLRTANGLERIIPVDHDGYFYIGWCLTASDDRVTSQNFADLLMKVHDRESGQTNDIPEVWRDKLVVIGWTAGGNDFTDRGATPLEKDTLLISRHWNVANAVITGRFIKRVALSVELAAIGVLGLLAAILTSRLRPLLAAGLVAALAGAYIGLGVFLFVRYQIWLSLVIPLAGAFVGTHVCLVTWRAVLKSVVSRIFSPKDVNE